jgi:hypothetical protein
MNLAERIESFAILGEHLRAYDERSTDTSLKPLQVAAQQAYARNPWFTPEQIRLALNSLGQALFRENLVNWISPYNLPDDGPANPRRVAVVMAGNIPAVGFHDFLSVLISGHHLLAKLSASDDQLIPAIAGMLAARFPAWSGRFRFTTGMIEQFDAVIATGSTNTSRYFDYYFGRYPNIIRRNRNSVAVLDGHETPEELALLADDILRYFGMGCRSISKVFVPAGYDFQPLTTALGKYRDYENHNKFRNNYEYTKSIMLVSQVPFLDTGFFLLKEDPSVNSRIATLHYEYYSRPAGVTASLVQNADSIQCVVSNMDLQIKTLHFGSSQNPDLCDYADGVDTLSFLTALN